VVQLILYLDDQTRASMARTRSTTKPPRTSSPVLPVVTTPRLQVLAGHETVTQLAALVHLASLEAE
jgi:hypothetical protein